MPIYEYVCPACQARFEVLRTMAAADRPVPCPQCAEPGQRQVSRFALKRPAAPVPEVSAPVPAHRGCSCCGPRR